jgi:hypothetical protein
VNGRVPDNVVLRDPRVNFNPQPEGGENVFALRLAKVLAETYQPRALLLNLAGTDLIGHSKGGLNDPDSLRPALVATDKALGELMDAYRQAGIFDQTLWVVTADHGMTPKGNVIVPAELYNTIGFTFQDGEQSFLPEVRLMDHGKAKLLAGQIANIQWPGITGAYYRTDDGDGYRYQPASATQAALPADLNATYLYLLGTFAGPYSPDVVVTTSGTTAFDKQRPSPGGSHNMINWADQHILIGFSGPGIAQGVESGSPARPVDLLPTIARLMALPAPDADGSVLADALAAPSPEEQMRQQALNAELAPMRDALAQTGEE